MENEYKAHRKPLILIAEDDDYCYMYLNEIFNRSSVELIRAINGVEAVEFCWNKPSIALVLMDLKMPIMNGFDATRHIKAINKKTPIIAITAYSMHEDETKAREAGCDDFITKPLQLMKIKEVINNHFLNEKLLLPY